MKLRGIILALILLLPAELRLGAQDAGGLDGRTDAFFRELRGDRVAVKANDWLRFAPVVFDLGAGALGLDARRSFAGRGVESVLAFGTMAAVTEGLKLTVRTVRPDGSDARSFPSGHAAVAFTGAELVRMEYGWGWGAGAYTVAASVAALQLYNGRHWLSDVLAGAGIGILSAHVGAWLAEPAGRLLGLDPSRTSFGLYPAPAPSLSASSGFSLAAAFSCTF